MLPSIDKPQHTSTRLLYAKVSWIAVYLFTAILVVPLGTSATTFILVNSGNKLYIGADAYRVNYMTNTTILHCKVTNSKGTITLTWGLAGGGTQSSPEYFSALVDPVSATDGTVSRKGETLMPVAKQFLVRQMDLRDAHQLPVNPEIIAHYTIGAAFVAFEDGTPQIGGFELRIKDWVSRDITEDPAPKNFKLDVLGLGNKQAYMEFRSGVAADQEILTQAIKDPLAFIRTLLMRQHQMTPNDVGPPYSIAILSGSQFSWIEEGACGQ